MPLVRQIGDTNCIVDVSRRHSKQVCVDGGGYEDLERWGAGGEGISN